MSSRPRRRSPSARSVTQLTGAEILRHSIGLGGSGLSRRRGRRTATAGPTTSSTAPARCRCRPVTSQTGSSGTLRTYQAEAVAWIGFLDGAGLGGCLALDMGLGKTPTVLAHLARAIGRWQHAGRRPGCSRRQLGGRGSALHAAAAGRRASRRIASLGRRARGRDRRCRHRHHHLCHCGPRHRRARRHRVGARWCSTRRRRSRTPPAKPSQQLRRIQGQHTSRAHRHSDRERSRRPVGHPRFHQPRSRRVATVVHRPDVGRRRGCPACPERAAAVPPHQDASRRSPPSCPTRSTSSTTAR